MPHSPLIIVGLDGAGFHLLDELFRDGHMPHVRQLAEIGERADLMSTLPVATLPAWTSFLTGRDPAQHGVADLFQRAPHSYGLVPANGAQRDGETFLARLSRENYAVASLGMPGTYPPEEVNGVCIAGFDAPGARRARADAVWPASFYGELQRLGGWRYATFNEHGSPRQRRGRAVEALLSDIDVKERIIFHVLRQRPWDVFCVHLQASDTAAHHLWHTYDSRSPRHIAGYADLLPRVYNRLDKLIGRLVAAAPQARFLLVSDHGMGGAANYAVHLNRWLHQQGLLQFSSVSSQRSVQLAGKMMRQALALLPLGSLGAAMRLLPSAALQRAMQTARGSAVNYAASEAFSDELDYAPSIWLNRRGVFPAGYLSDEQAQALSQRIRLGLMQLRHPVTGQPLVAHVHTRLSLPPGPHAARLPDLLIEPAWPEGYRPSFLTSSGPGPVVTYLSSAACSAPRGSGMPGVHERAGIYIAAGPGIACQRRRPMHITAAGRRIYELLDLPTNPRFPPPTQPVPANDPYTATDRAELLSRLESLGYV